MVNEAYSVQSHGQCIEQILNDLRGYCPILSAEHKLPNGRIADILAIDRHNIVTIIEIKTHFRESLLLSAYDKYRQFCDWLYVGVPALVLADLRHDPILNHEHRALATTGILGIYPGCMAILREAQNVPMSALSRQSLFNYPLTRG